MNKLPPESTRIWLTATIVILLLLGLYLRTAGLYRTLEANRSFRADEAKQIAALSNFLHGHYVWYTDSVYYDGYPLFLNHVDEWILRPYQWIRLHVLAHLDPDTRYPDWPPRQQLYYWARTLRVVYGMVVLLLSFILARMSGMGRPASLTALALMALAPLSVAVAHAASGDIGVDLFTALVILFTLLYARRKQPLYAFFIGLFCAFAFAAKYHGALTALIPAMFIFLSIWIDPRTLRRHFYGLLVMILGTATGIIAAIPQLLTVPHQTWRDIRRNFVFIKNYNAPEAYLGWSWWEKLRFGFLTNSLHITEALGLLIIIGAIGGLIWAFIQLSKSKRALDTVRPNANLAPAWFAIALYPFLILVIALSGKPMVIPLHFAALQLPLTLGCAFFINALWKSKRFIGQATAFLISAAMLTSLALVAGSELFYWQRPDVISMEKSYQTELFEPDYLPRSSTSGYYAPKDTLRRLYIEPWTITEFRNRACNIRLPDTPYWIKTHIPPVPIIPYPFDAYWVLVHGPVFPRNDRAFRIPANHPIERGLVFLEHPDTVHVGIRTGHLPARLDLEVGGDRQTVSLPSNSQRVITLHPRRFRRTALPRGQVSDLTIITLDARSRPGPAWLTILANEKERRHFNDFGGAARPPSAGLSSNEYAEAVHGLSQALYLKGNLAGLKRTSDDDPLYIGNKALALEAGCYRFAIDARARTTNAVVTISLDDESALARQYIPEQDFTPGYAWTSLTYRFSKPLAPYECGIKIITQTGTVEFGAWDLRPDFEQMLLITNAAPLSPEQEPFPDGTSNTVCAFSITFGKGYEIKSICIPNVLDSTKPLPIMCEYVLPDPPPNFQDYFIFLHFHDAEDRQVAAIDFPIWMASFNEPPTTPIYRKIPDDLPPGPYHLAVGIWNGRLRKRLPVKKAPAGLRIIHDKVMLKNMVRISNNAPEIHHETDHPISP